MNNSKFKFTIMTIMMVIVYALWLCAILYLTTKFGVFGFIGGLLLAPGVKNASRP